MSAPAAKYVPVPDAGKGIEYRALTLAGVVGAACGGGSSSGTQAPKRARARADRAGR